MSKNPENFPSKTRELYRLTPELKNIDFENVETPETTIVKSQEQGAHTLAEALEESFDKADIRPEDPRPIQRAVIARLASEGNYRVSHVEPGDKIWIQGGALHLETTEGEKLFFPLTDQKPDKATEGFTLVGKREDIHSVSRRALDFLKDQSTTNLYEYMRATGLSFKNDRPKLWQQMKDGGITVQELKENKALKDIADDFLEREFSINKNNASQNIAILQYLKKKDSELESKEE